VLLYYKKRRVEVIQLCAKYARHLGIVHAKAVYGLSHLGGEKAGTLWKKTAREKCARQQLSRTTGIEDNVVEEERCE